MTVHGHSTGNVVIRRSRAGDDAIVREIFGALHGFNAALDARLALTDGWDAVLADHLLHERAAGYGITLLAWESGRPVGLMMMDGHSDPPLFR